MGDHLANTLCRYLTKPPTTDASLLSICVSLFSDPVRSLGQRSLGHVTLHSELPTLLRLFYGLHENAWYRLPSQHRRGHPDR